MKFLTLTLSLYLFFLLSPALAQNFESKPTLKASEILPTSLLKGEGYSLSENVLNDGYMNTYKLTTSYGDMEVQGTYFLIKRIFELGPIAYLDENYGSVTVAAQGAGEVARDIVTGPVKGGQKLYENVSDTDKLAKTAKSIPSGISGLIKVAAHGVSAAADYTYEAGKSIVSSDGEKTDEHLSQGWDFIEEQTLDFVGYSDAYRNLSRELQVDPYTQNKVLHSELKRVATVKASVKVGSKFTPSLYSIPGVGAANKYLGYAQKTATYKDPKELEELDNKMLEVLGKTDKKASEKIAEAAKQIKKNTSYSPPMRHELISAIKSMEDVKNVEVLLQQAANAKSRYVANFYLQAINKLSDMNKTNAYAFFVSDLLLPAALTTENSLIVPLPVDYLVWTSDVAKIFNFFKKSVLKSVDKPTVTLLIAGSVSPRCKDELTALGVTSILERESF